MSFYCSGLLRLQRGALMAMWVAGSVGCASLPAHQGYQEANRLVETRIGLAPVYPDDGASVPGLPELSASPIDAEQAVRIAFLHSPRVAVSWARIGLSRADLEAARRLVNPGLSLVHLNASQGGEQISRSLALSVSDVLLRPVRQRYAVASMQQMQLQVASELQALAIEVEIGWYQAVAADQIAETRSLIAEAAGQSALLAQRFFEAGNINRLQLAQEQAASATASIESSRARMRAVQARSDLASLMGLPVEAHWATSRLPELPAADAVDPDSLVSLATAQRLDLIAARQQLDLREDAFATARRWRWLGRFEVGYERESEADGGVMRGPTFSIELPIFNQGQDVLARAEAQRAEAEARFDQARLEVRNNVRAALEGMQMAREVAERYQVELVPAREEVITRTQEEVNFMLKGVFELIAAKQAGYDAWQGYLESVRDYWIEHTRLRAAVGGLLPDMSGPTNPITPHPISAVEQHVHGDTQ